MQLTFRNNFQTFLCNQLFLLLFTEKLVYYFENMLIKKDLQSIFTILDSLPGKLELLERLHFPTMMIRFSDCFVCVLFILNLQPEKDQPVF